MKCNEGKLDRIIRAIVGIVLILFALFYSTGFGFWTYVLLVVGIILIITAITGFCLLYVPFKINTCKK